MDQRAAECQLLFHASGQFSGPAVTEWFELVIDFPDEIIILLDSCSENHGKEFQVLLHGQVLVKRETPRHIPYPVANGAVIFYHVVTRYLRRTAVSEQHGREYAKNRRLTRTVRTDEPEYLPRFYFKGNLVHSQHLSLVVCICHLTK